MAAARAGSRSGQRLHQIIGRVIVRVGQADQAVRRLNAFAHSADLETAARPTPAGVGRDRAFVRAHRRPLNNATLEHGAREPRPRRWPAGRLLVEQAMWACLEAVVAAGAKEMRLSVVAGPAGDDGWCASRPGDAAEAPSGAAPGGCWSRWGARCAPWPAADLELELPLAGSLGPRGG